MKATVVICAHADERWNDLVRAVASIEAQSLAASQVVVVIDHNPSLFERAKATFAEANVVENDGPRGESGARNAGVAVARHPVLAFLDDDAAADRQWLEWLLPWFEDPDVLGVGGKAEAVWDAGRPRWFPPEFDWVVGCSYHGLPTEAAPIRNLMGCNMSIRREVIGQAGGFYLGLGRTGNDGFGCSETEFCLRAQRVLGGRFVFEPRAHIAHRVPVDRTTWRYFTARCRAEGRSKAHLADREGSGTSLALERAYIRRTLPAGVVRGLADFARFDRAGLARSLAIVAGLGWTATGYVAANATRRPGQSAVSPVAAAG